MQFSADNSSDQSVVVTLKGVLDANSAPSFRSQIEAIVKAKPERVEVDLSSLRLIDSTGVGAIVSLFKRTRAYGGRFMVLGVQGQPRTIFEVLRLDRAFGQAAAS